MSASNPNNLWCCKRGRTFNDGNGHWLDLETCQTKTCSFRKRCDDYCKLFPPKRRKKGEGIK